MRSSAQAGSGTALWGTGGRGPRKTGAILAVLVLVLCLPLSAGARSFRASHSSATVPASLVSAAKAHPQQMFDVIVQSTDGATSADAARAVRGAAVSRVVKRQYRALGSVSASVTGAGLLRLAKRPGVFAITLDSSMTSTVKNPQKWPDAAGDRWFWGSPTAKSSQAETETRSRCRSAARSKVAQDNASWNSASWVDASWNTASWNSASWNSASWHSDSFESASWNSASWLKVLGVDNAANETGGDG